jgi:hypothetical protein
MLDDFRKSINSVLYERMTSPLFGALLISWCIWNWDILYFLFADREYYSVFLKVAYAQLKLKNLITQFYSLLSLPYLLFQYSH